MLGSSVGQVRTTALLLLLLAWFNRASYVWNYCFLLVSDSSSWCVVCSCLCMLSSFHIPEFVNLRQHVTPSW
ncbi:hypothetical protein SETIT_2G041000v2 [Setaria italica]|uniref:Uncharacterized protein n=1 Tax=Setaria italica TaxID=4555 RepID=A0A368PX68_SETIT|nr:hypothetical protein SETIT_2G041000v2 [Setaria italica]